MFITTKYSGYNRAGEQSAGGLFLILLARDGKLDRDGLRAVVRYVRMRQLGQFMMGSANIGRKHLTLSGTYGNDGLPLTVDDATWQRGVPVPPELYDKWNTGGGWNGPGTEATDLRAWALQHLVVLQGRRRAKV